MISLLVCQAPLVASPLSLSLSLSCIGGGGGGLEASSMEVENRVVTTKHYISGRPSESDFEIRTARLRLAVEEEDVIIVRNLYVSVDPYQLNRMKDSSPSHSVADRINPGTRVSSFGAGKVVATGKNSELKVGDTVVGLLGWEDYTVAKPGTNMLNKIADDDEFPLSYHLSVLGTSGLAAYAGFFDVCKPNKGDKVFVSAAFGSVGNLVGQYAKLFGCYVIGCTGTDNKVALLKEKLGFDDAFNYKKEPDLKSALKRHFPEGINIYFDNVGGEMLEAAVANMNTFGKIAVCGVISEYTEDTNTGKRAACNMLEVLYKRINIQGFLIIDHLNVYADYISETSDHLRHGRLHVIEDISQGLNSLPHAFAGLFRGDNVGKKLVKVYDA